MPDLNIPAIANTESGASVRAKLNMLLGAIRDGTLIGDSDFADDYRNFVIEVLTRITAAETEADDVADQVQSALDRLNEVEDLTAGLSAEQLTLAQNLVDAIANLDLAAIEDLTGIAVAGLSPDGWVRDPAFRNWASGNLQHWFTSGVTTWGSQDPSGAFGSGLRFALPAGSPTQAQIIAASTSVNMMRGADLSAEYVVAKLQMRALSGLLNSAFLRVEWQSGGLWYRGHAFGQTNSQGRLIQEWGITTDPNRLFSREVVFQRPVAADAVRLVFIAKSSSGTSAAELRIDLLDIRAATEAEIKAHLANAYALGLTDSLALSILGPDGVIEALRNELRTGFQTADAAISTTVAAISTAQSAQALRLTNIESTFEDGNLVRNSDFKDGPLGTGVAPAWWSSWPTSWRVIARGSDSTTAVTTAPTRCILKMPANAAGLSAIAYQGPARPGERVNVSFRGATSGPSPRSASLWLRVQWLDGAGSEVNSEVAGVNGITNVAFETFTFDAIGPAPEGTEQIRILFQRGGGGSGDAYVTQLDVRKVDVGARALISEAQTTAASAVSAISTMQTRVSASFAGGWNAFVSATATAYASAQKAASALVFRTTSGGGSAAIKLTAWDDEAGTGAAILLDAANIIAPGTIGAGELVITDLGFNMVPDNQFQSTRAWSNGAIWTVVPNSTFAAADSQGDIRTASGAVGTTWSRSFPVRAGQVLTCSGQIGRTGGTSHNANVLLRYFNAAGDEIGRTTIGGTGGLSTAGGMLTVEAVRTVPTNAKTAQIGCEVLASNGGGRVGFAGASVVRRTKGSSLITPDGAFFDMLTARSAWIRELNVVEGSFSSIVMMDGAFGRMLSGTRNTNLSLATADGWTNILTLTVPANMIPGGGQAKAIISPTTNFATPPDAPSSRTVGLRLLVGGNVVWSEEYDYSNSGDLRSLAFTIAATVSNGDAIQWQMRRVSGGSVDHIKTYMSAINLLKVG